MMQITKPLVQRLSELAEVWAAASDATPARLGRVVVNDTGFFARIAQPGASVTTATLEKFAGFLADPANWPGGAVPVEANELAHVVGISAAAPGLSPGKAGGNSRLFAQGDA